MEQNKGSIHIEELLKELTLEEKAGLLSGADFWHTKAVKRLNIPDVMVTDGPHGLRKQESDPDHLGITESVAAVCFPPAVALACSYDRDLMRTLGEALGDECQAEKVSTLLGPGVNIKRSPLCGRNFEYYSEDPYLAGEMAAEFVNGVQSKNIGTSLKHFAANNQETRRMSISSEVDERTLREIYLSNFETVVKKAQPYTVMCSYNRINGVYSSENDWLLNKVLRDEWGFEGLVVTDWGAVNDRVLGVKAGLDLEMPASSGVRDKEIVKAVNNGTLSMEDVDRSVRRVLKLVETYYNNVVEDATYDKEAHHDLARRIASECAVLLKNDGILPLKEDMEVAFIGEFAKEPRFQGGGSSHINSFKVSNAVDAAKDTYKVTYAKGYSIREDKVDANLVAEAVKAAKEAKVAVVFVGLPDSFESEGYDRTHMNLPNCQNHLVQEILKVQPNTVIVMYNGSPVVLPWANDVKAIIEMYLSGQAVGEATVDLLYGKVNPSGKLAETFPLRVEDNPSYINFPGTSEMVTYSEGIFVGYRYYDKKNLEVRYPFGYGLSYTTFEYSNLTVSSTKIKDTDSVTVTVNVKNTGNVYGKEIVQLYVKDVEASVLRPEKELKGFEKVSLNPGEEKTVSFTLDKRSFAFYNTNIHDWYVESGSYEVLVGKSSKEIVLTQVIEVESTTKIPYVITDSTTIGDVYRLVKDPSPIERLLAMTPLSPASADVEGFNNDMIKKMFDEMPIHSILSFIGFGNIGLEDIDQVIKELNEQIG
ncbi:MAG: glycosyl hydrolase [Anaerocolumna sp.]|jgi:beta-glucosidase|nr:glycosyl hydrolase [Anaerocolumna sp.]